MAIFFAISKLLPPKYPLPPPPEHTPYLYIGQMKLMYRANGVGRMRRFILPPPTYRFPGAALSFRPRGGENEKRTQSFSETNAVFLKNDCVRFSKRAPSKSNDSASKVKEKGGADFFYCVFSCKFRGNVVNLSDFWKFVQHGARDAGRVMHFDNIEIKR